jgi:hypothetical protein
MRPIRIPALVLAALLLPLSLPAEKKPSTEAKVEKLEGTIMVEHVNLAGVKENIALETLKVVSRGDVVTVYDRSWVVLRTAKGDKIGLEGPAVAAFDELFKGGPDRQVRILLKSGTAHVRAKGAGSRQSYFEVHTGPVMSTLSGARCSFEFDPAAERVEIRSFGGKLKTTDANGDRKYYLHSRRVWEKGLLTQRDPLPLPANAALGFKRFFEGEPLE